MNTICNLTVHFVVSRQLPMVDKKFECCILGIEPNDMISFTEKVIVPTSIDVLDNNLIKIKTNEENVTYVALYPSLESGNVIIGKTKKLPYLEEKLEYQAFNFNFNTLNDFTISFKEKKGTNSRVVRRCAKDTYLIITDEILYILKKDCLN